MRHQQCGGGAEFDAEVAVGNASSEFSQTPSKPSSFATNFAVDRVGGASQRGGAERQAADALAAVGEALLARCVISK